MKKMINKILNYIMLRGKDLLEFINQKFFFIFYGCLLFNIIIIFYIVSNKDNTFFILL